MKPRSRGRITLVSADPGVPPRIEHRYDSEPADIADLQRGVQEARELAGMSAFENAFPANAALPFVRSDSSSLLGLCASAQPARASRATQYVTVDAGRGGSRKTASLDANALWTTYPRLHCYRSSPVSTP